MNQPTDTYYPAHKSLYEPTPVEQFDAKYENKDFDTGSFFENMRVKKKIINVHSQDTIVIIIGLHNIFCDYNLFETDGDKRAYSANRIYRIDEYQ